VVDGKGKSWEQRDNNEGPPSGAFAVGSNDAIHEGITNLIVDFCIVDDSAEDIEGQ
jgi:hypothetical protein